MLDLARGRVDTRHDDRDPPLPESLGNYLPAVVLPMCQRFDLVCTSQEALARRHADDRDDAHRRSGSAEWQSGRLDGKRLAASNAEKRNRNLQLTERNL